MTSALVVYEGDFGGGGSVVGGSGGGGQHHAAQRAALVVLVGSLLMCRGFDKDDYEALVTKTAQFAARLLKKTDQCRTVMLCSHLFYTGSAEEPGSYRNPQRVLECLQRSLKIADACTMASPTNVQLFVDILDRYVFYFELGNPVVSHKFVSGLVALIDEHMESIDGGGVLGGSADDGMGVGADSASVRAAREQFRQIVQYVRAKKADPRTAEAFRPIVC